MENQHQISIFCDGGSRGNPGPAAYGFVVKKNEKLLYEEAKKLGFRTNNIAEYFAVISALKWISNNNQNKIPVTFFLDSALVVNQLNGLFKVKSDSIRPFFIKAKDLIKSCDFKVTFVAIPREKNTHADKMVNKALDNLV